MAYSEQDILFYVFIFNLYANHRIKTSQPPENQRIIHDSLKWQSRKTFELFCGNVTRKIVFLLLIRLTC